MNRGLVDGAVIEVASAVRSACTRRTLDARRVGHKGGDLVFDVMRVVTAGAATVTALLGGVSSIASVEPGQRTLPFPAGIGFMTAPRRPIVPAKLPKGWTGGVVERDSVLQGGVHTLYLRRNANAIAGPALVVGTTSQDGEFAPVCDGALDRAYDDPSTYRPDGIMIHGADAPVVRMHDGYKAILILGPSDVTRAEGYVLGRRVSDQQLRAAAAAVTWGTPFAPPPEIGAAGLPAGFARRGTTFLSPWQQPTAAQVQYRPRRGPGEVRVGAATGNAAFRRFARFWAQGFEPACGATENGGPSQIIRGSVVRVDPSAGKRSQRAARDMQRQLEQR